MIEDENKEIKKEEAVERKPTTPIFNAQKQAAQIEATAKLPGPAELEPVTTMPPQAIEDMEGFSPIGENSLGRNLYRLEQKAGVNSRDRMVSNDIRNLKFTKVLEQSEYNPLQKAELLDKFNEEVKKSGGRPPKMTPEQMFNVAQRQTAQRANYEISKRIEDQFNDLTDIIQEDPAAGAAALSSYTADLSKSLAAAGYSPEQIETKVEQYRRNAVNMAVDSFTKTDPAAARNYLSQNKDNLSPADYRKAENRIARTEKAIESAQKEQLFEAIKPGVMSLNVEEIAEIGKLDTPAGEVAREFSRKLENDPIKAVEDGLSPLSIKDSASMVTRIAEIAEIEERLSTSNRPVEIPYLTSGNMKNIKKQAMKGNVEPILNFFSNMLQEDAAKVAKQFEDGGQAAIGLAARLAVVNPEMARDAIAAAGSNAPLPRNTLTSNISLFSDESYNNAVRDQVRNLSKLDKYKVENPSDARELAERVANIQDVNPGIFSLENKLPVPHGFNGEQFRKALDELFGNPEKLRQFSNGRIKGSGESGGKLDYGDVEIRAFRPGVYLFYKDGKPIITEDDSYFAIDMEKALNEL